VNTRTGTLVVVAECKRVDPKLGRWLFARQRYSRAGGLRGTFVSAIRTDPNSRILQEQTHNVSDADPYHIGLEMRTNKDGDGVGHSKSAIDLAVTQAFLGTAGVMEYTKHHPRAFTPSDEPTVVLPVIFTTAALLVTNDDLSQADVRTGELGALTTQALPWLWYETNLSRDLRASLQPDTPSAPISMENVVVHRHTRGALIVSATRDGLLGFINTVDSLVTSPL